MIINKGRRTVAPMVKKLTTSDLIKVYGKFYFAWDLASDAMTWRGPINKIFGTDIPFLTGSSFLNQLTPHSFWSRFNQLDQRKVSSYSVSYPVFLPSQEECTLIEEGLIQYNQAGSPILIQGNLRVEDEGKEDKVTSKNLTGYDLLTGFPSKEVLIENLTCLMDQKAEDPAPGGYLVVSVDKLSSVYFHFGLEALKQTISKVGTVLRSSTRFNDIIGRTSACCFGIILNETDEWGVSQAANRLLNICKDIEISGELASFNPVVSLGGAAFRKGIPPLTLIMQAERTLFEVQNAKSVALVSVGNKKTIKVSIERPVTQEVGKRRIGDLKRAQRAQAALTPGR